MTAPQAVLWLYIAIVGMAALTALWGMATALVHRWRRRRARKRFEEGVRIMQARLLAQREAVQRRMFTDFNQDEIAAAARSLSARLENLDRRYNGR